MKGKKSAETKFGPVERTSFSGSVSLAPIQMHEAFCCPVLPFMCMCLCFFVFFLFFCFVFFLFFCSSLFFFFFFIN